MNAFFRPLVILAASTVLLTAASCQKKEAPVTEPVVAAEDQAKPQPADTPAAKKEIALDQLSRSEFNRAALRLNLPLFWMYEETPNNTVRPEVLTTLNFYPTSETLVWKDKDGNFTEAFKEAYAQLVDILKDPTQGRTLDASEVERLKNVAAELDQAAVNVVRTDLSDASDQEKAFVKAMLKVGSLIDNLYAQQNGLDLVMSKIPENDVLSRSMARRNWSAKAMSPQLAKVTNSSAIAGNPRIPVGIYPESLQADPNFCKMLQEAPNAQHIMTPFTVVIQEGDKLKGIPYSEYYKTDMKAVSDALKEAAKLLESDASEAALHAYLTAAAESFLTNNWDPADEAWAAMNSHNSKWYVRVAPDEVYWDPCSRKAGFHMAFAHINPDALQWQDKIAPVRQEMESRIAALAGAPYEERQVSFHLPDFIDIISNSGDDRDPFGATVGQSLPNWGPVANEGRGRTVVMSNLYTDPDSIIDRQTLASSLFTEKDITLVTNSTGVGLLGTIIHEATHNLGPAHEYKVDDKVDDDIFGGDLASMAEELKAQSGALWFLKMFVDKGIISQEQAEKSYADSVYWIFNQISRGLTDADGNIQPYPQLAGIQLGMMLEDGAVVFDPEAMAANGKDKGAFILNMEKMPACVERIMTEITKIKATGNKDALVALQQKHINGTAIPFALISERMLRIPKTSFVYSIVFEK